MRAPHPSAEPHCSCWQPCSTRSDGEQLAQHAAHEVVYHAGNGEVLAGLVDLTARLLIERHGSRAEGR